MAEIYPGGGGLSDLVEEVVSEELQQVAISSLGPGGVLLKPAAYGQQAVSGHRTSAKGT